MTSDIRGLRTKEEYIEGSSISYIPSILAIPNKSLFALDVNKINFKEFKIEKDSVNPSFLTPEMTEIAVAKASSQIHSFIPYGKGIKFRKDQLQNSGLNVQGMHNDIIRELSIQFDRLALTGDGTNNGLITSTDSNYITQTSAEIPAISGDGFNRILKAREIAVDLNLKVNDLTASSSLTIYFYGEALIKFLGQITANQETDVRSHIQRAFAGKSVNFVEISALALPSSLALGNGIVVVSNDLTELQHAGLPDLTAQGVNDEDDYYWARYFFGSSQIRPTRSGAVIKQPITFA